MKEKLQTYKEIHDELVTLTNRWVKAWNAGYTHGTTINSVDFDRELIFFSALVPDACNTPGSMSLKYFDDDTSLETDSKITYETVMTRRREKQKQIEELKQHPEVQKFLNLSKRNEYFIPFDQEDFGIYVL